MNTNRFEFKVANGEEKPAIWFRLRDRDVWVFPLSLFDILHDCYQERRFSRDVKATFQIFKDEVCGYFFDDTCGYYIIDYQRDCFLESAIQSLKDLCNAVVRKEPVFYNGNRFNEETATQMLIGLNNLTIPESYHQIQDDEIKVERFYFAFVEPYNCDTRYVIKVGNRKYSSSLSDWTADYDSIRLYIENCFMHCRTNMEIQLRFEDDPTIIKLYTQTYGKKDAVSRVTIIPDSFHKVPNIYGWCNTFQLVSSLYLGLLGVCIKDTDWDEFEYHGGSWEAFRLATYNKLQSCAIEDFIQGIYEDEFTYRPRQRMVNSVKEMHDDYWNLQKTLAL